jgi:predicted RNase H-like HicB family nuclease
LRAFTVVLDPDEEEGGYTVTVPALPGCITQGDSFEDAIARARDAIQGYLESMVAHGETIPLDPVAEELTQTGRGGIPFRQQIEGAVELAVVHVEAGEAMASAPA